MNGRSNGALPRGPVWIAPLIGCGVALANLVVLYLFVFGFYGMSTPNPNPPTSHVFGIPTDMFFYFFFLTAPGALVLWLTWQAAGKKSFGVVLAVIYLALVFFFAQKTATSVAEARERVNEMKRQWQDQQRTND